MTTFFAENVHFSSNPARRRSSVWTETWGWLAGGSFEYYLSREHKDVERKLKKPPAERCLVLLAFRHRKGWTQDQLADATGVSAKMLSQYESGERVPKLQRLLRLSAAMGFGPEEVDCALFGLEAICDPPSPETEQLSEGERLVVRHQSALAGLAQARAMRSELLAAAREQRWREERERAEPYARRLIGLAAQPTAARRTEILIAELPQELAWAVVEHLIAACKRAIVIEPSRALALSELGCRVADAPRTQHRPCPRLQARALAFKANAQRVLGDLAESELSFQRAGRLLKVKAGSGSGPGLPAWRFLDLQASLRRDQRRFPEALSLSDQALILAPPAEHGRLLLNRAAALQPMGEFEQAIETLRRASPLIDGERDPRLLWVLRFNLVVNLIDGGRAEEAEPLLSATRELALDLGNEVDVVRCVGQGGRIAADLGRRAEALAALAQARGDFTALQLPCDAALAALDEAVLRLQMGQLREVKVLAAEILWVFAARGVGRESLAALGVFCRAAKLEKATLELAQQAIKALKLGA
jgi:transcriptional regulator with XRE-family HTH domain